MSRILRSGAILAAMSLSGPVLAGSLHGTLYKDPNCSCCEGHAAYLREHGIDVDIKPADNLLDINAKAGMPADYQGCHTIMLNGYAIEGHVTAEIIDKLLKERPADVVGISLPGMPLGVPGMGGEKEGLYKVYAIHKDGSATVFATE
jgi:hypothetical protein